MLENSLLAADPTTPGGAIAWTWTQQATAMAFASFAHSRFERFEEWSPGMVTYRSLAETTASAAMFGTVDMQPRESFERGWLDNETFESSLGQVQAALVASFEAPTWTGAAFLYAFAPSDLSPGAFAPSSAAIETFEWGWRSNQTFSFQLPATAGFPVETFEDVKADQPFTVSLATQQFIAVAHGFVTNERAKLYNKGDGALPANTNNRLKYFVVAPTSDTFKLALDAGGAAVTVGDPGVGSNYVKADTNLYWTELL